MWQRSALRSSVVKRGAHVLELDLAGRIERLEENVRTAKPVPLTDQVRVDRQEVLEISAAVRGRLAAESSQTPRSSG